MLPADVRLLSADDHVIEPPDTWLERVPSKYRDVCPRVVEKDGRQAWLYEDQLAHLLMGSCRPLPGFDPAGYPPAPGTANFDEIRPGCYDPSERLKDMDIDGVYGQLCFPNFPRFAGHRFYWNVKDHALGRVCLQAYNDFLIDTWCATDPARLYGAVVLPLHDVELAVAELQRVLKKGAKAVAFSENPTVLGLPSVHTEHWDPLWAVASEARVPICMHIGSSSRLMTTSEDAPPPVVLSLVGVNSMMTATDWLFSGILERFPDLKVVLSEGGAGWVPYMLERMDKAFFDIRTERNVSIGQTKVGKVPPSELFRRQMYACLVDEHFALQSLDHLPLDNILWEGDFPHGDGLWPENRRYLEKGLADVPEEDARKIVETNLAGLLQL